MQKFIVINISIAIFLLISCKPARTLTPSEKSMLELVGKYSQLSNNRNKQSYILLRSFIDNEQKFKIDLFEDTLNNEHKIIVVTNKEDNTYAIPMFSGNALAYWNIKGFESDTSNLNIKTTFENEIKNCNKTLRIYTSRSKGNNFFFVRFLFEHILLCREFDESKSFTLPVDINYQGEYNFSIKLLKEGDFKINPTEGIRVVNL